MTDVIATTVDELVVLLDDIDEERELPRRFQLYAMCAARLSVTLTEVPPSRERDLHLLQLRDSIVRVMVGPEPTLQ